MKQTGRFNKLALLGAVILASTLLTDAQAQSKATTAKVRSIRGTAQISEKAGEWTTLKVNDTVGTGAVIRTGADSEVFLFLNQSVVRITPESTMGLDKLIVTETGADKVTETQLSIKSGKVLGNVKKLAAASKYEIKSPTGVAGIRGTDFQIVVTPLGNGKYKFLVTSVQGTIVGSAVNQQNNLVTAVVNTGETWDPDKEVVEILPPEVLAILRKLVPENVVEDTITIPGGQIVIIRDEQASQTSATQ